MDKQTNNKEVENVKKKREAKWLPVYVIQPAALEWSSRQHFLKKKYLTLVPLSI